VLCRVDVSASPSVVVHDHAHDQWSVAVLCFLGWEPAGKGATDAPGAYVRRLVLPRLDSASGARPRQALSGGDRPWSVSRIMASTACVRATLLITHHRTKRAARMQ